MQDSPELGYKGFMLKESSQTGSYHLVSPTGVKVAIFSYALGRSMPMIHSLVDELHCGENHPTQEHAIKYIADSYECLTTTRWERLRTRASRFIAHGGWGAVAALAATVGAIAAIIAATVGILTYVNTITAQ